MVKKAAAGKARAKATKTKTKPASAKGAAPAASTAKASPSETQKMIGSVDLGNLMRRCLSLKKQGKEIAGSMGDLVASAVENKNLDKPAFDIARKLKGMSPQKRLTTIACLLYYIDVLKLDEAEDGQSEMQIPRPEAGEKNDGATSGADAPRTAAKPTETPDGPKDLRPPHLRTVTEGGTKVDHVDDLKKAAGATGAAAPGSAAQH